MNEDKDKVEEKNTEQKNETGNSSQKIYKRLGWIVVLAIASAIVVLLFYYFNFSGQLSDDHGIWGQFGDYVGGILNPILSFLALIALLITIVIQSRGLELSGEELKLTRNELKRSSDAQNEQSETLKKQLEAQNRTFEQTERFRAIDLIYNDDLKAGPRLKAEAVKTYVQVERIRIAREQREAEENGTTPPEPYINLSYAKLENVMIIGFDLNHVNFFKATLTDANLMEATLTNVSLLGANLKDIKNWRKIKSIKGANITDVKNAPEGFIEWALENGAVIDEEDSETPDEDTEDSNDPFQTPKK